MTDQISTSLDESHSSLHTQTYKIFSNPSPHIEFDWFVCLFGLFACLLCSVFRCVSDDVDGCNIIQILFAAVGGMNILA